MDLYTDCWPISARLIIGYLGKNVRDLIPRISLICIVLKIGVDFELKYFLEEKDYRFSIFWLLFEKKLKTDYYCENYKIFL